MSELSDFMHRPPGTREVAAVVLVAAVLGTLVLAGLSNGYFLSDDLGHLPFFAKWSAEGSLVPEILARFVSGVDGVNAYYRPLTFLSFAIDFRLHGVNATGWLAVNLALHVGSAFVLGWLAWLLLADRSRAALAAATFSGCLFAILSPGWEVALWIACRYDALATFLVLLAGAWFLRRGRSFDRWACASLLASLGALLSKESGAAAIVLVTCLGLAGTVDGHRPSRPARDLLAPWLAVVWPWVALLFLYGLLRLAIFHSAFLVQRDSGWPNWWSVDHWRNVGVTMEAWAGQVFPGAPGPGVVAAASAVSLVLGAWLAWEDSRKAGVRLAAVLASLVASIGLLLPHIHGFEATGIGGRLFYQMSAFFCLVIALGVHAALLAPARRRAVSVAVLACAAFLLATHAFWGRQAAQSYSQAHAQMRSLATAIEKLANDHAGGNHFIVIVPDSIGRVSFGRNGQAGLMLPPVQPRPLSDRVLVQTDAEIPGLEAKLRGGILDALRERSLFEVIAGKVATRTGSSPDPQFFCWSSRPGRLRPLEIRAASIAEGRLAMNLVAALQRAGCA